MQKKIILALTVAFFFMSFFRDVRVSQTVLEKPSSIITVARVPLEFANSQTNVYKDLVVVNKLEFMDGVFNALMIFTYPFTHWFDGFIENYLAYFKPWNSMYNQMFNVLWIIIGFIISMFVGAFKWLLAVITVIYASFIINIGTSWEYYFALFATFGIALNLANRLLGQLQKKDALARGAAAIMIVGLVIFYLAPNLFSGLDQPQKIVAFENYLRE